MSNACNALLDWSNQMAQHHLPRWEDLPDIDLYMDQVISLLDKYLIPLSSGQTDHFVTASMINNYVKLHILPPPVKKRYNRGHLAQLVVITLLKQVLSITEIKQLLDLHLAQQELSLAYDSFCAAQEHAYAQMAQQAARATAPGMCTPDLAVELAVQANAGKILAEKLIAQECSGAALEV